MGEIVWLQLGKKAHQFELHLVQLSAGLYFKTLISRHKLHQQLLLILLIPQSPHQLLNQPLNLIHPLPFIPLLHNQLILFFILRQQSISLPLYILSLGIPFGFHCHLLHLFQHVILVTLLLTMFEQLLSHELSTALIHLYGVFWHVVQSLIMPDLQINDLELVKHITTLGISYFLYNRQQLASMYCMLFLKKPLHFLLRLNSKYSDPIINQIPQTNKHNILRLLWPYKHVINYRQKRISRQISSEERRKQPPSNLCEGYVIGGQVVQKERVLLKKQLVHVLQVAAVCHGELLEQEAQGTSEQSIKYLESKKSVIAKQTNKRKHNGGYIIGHSKDGMIMPQQANNIFHDPSQLIIIQWIFLIQYVYTLMSAFVLQLPELLRVNWQFKQVSVSQRAMFVWKCVMFLYEVFQFLY